MFDITIVNVKTNSRVALGARRFYCGRGSPVGNRFVMRDRSDAERNRVCDLYHMHFGNLVQMGYVNEMYEALKTSNIELACYCAPLRCHCETIVQKLEYLQMLEAMDDAESENARDLFDYDK